MSTSLAIRSLAEKSNKIEMKLTVLILFVGLLAVTVSCAPFIANGHGEKTISFSGKGNDFIGYENLLSDD